MYGIAEDGKPVRVVVAEQISDKEIGEFGRQHNFGSFSTTQAGKAIASWARLPTLRHPLTGERPPRIVDVYRRRDDRALARERVAVSADRRRLQATRWG